MNLGITMTWNPRPSDLTAVPGYETAVGLLLTGAGATAGLGVLGRV